LSMVGSFGKLANGDSAIMSCSFPRILGYGTKAANKKGHRHIVPV